MKRKDTILIGVLSPILYFVASFIGGFYNEGYNHVKHSVSELLIDGVAGLAVVNSFMLLSNIVLIFAGTIILVKLKDINNKALKMGICFIHIPGITNILSGFVFKLSEGTEISFGTTMHIIFVAVSAISSLIGVIMIAISYNKTFNWNKIKLFSIASLSILIIGGLSTPIIISSGVGIVGLVERISVLSLNVWYVVFLFRLSNDIVIINK
jgi:hypothetical protein